MKVLIGTLLFCSALTMSQTAIASDTIECTVTEVLNSDFENVYDFTFSDYPNVSYETQTSYGPTLTVGAMSFAENDDMSPADLTVTKTAQKLEIVAQPEESNEVIKLTVEGKVGLLEANSGEGPLVPVARVKCK